MPVYKLNAANDQTLDNMDYWGSSPMPIDNQSSHFHGIEQSFDNGSCVGLWHSSVGQWQRQIKEAEMCYFLEGACTYTTEEGEDIEIKAGDLVHFSENSLGIWTIHEPSQKVFITYKSVVI